MQAHWMLVVALAAGCLKPAEVTQCGAFTCGLGAICSPDGTSCVAPETVNACNGHADGERCTYTGVSTGVCQAGVCIPGGCGNGIVETALGEVCDDGNLVSLDGCRGDCKSTEVCGDGIQDLAANEYCDCGTAAAPSTIPPCDGPNSDAPGAICRTNCTLGRCGDGVLDPGEICDDGNTVAGDGCRADCAGRWTAMASGTFQHLYGVWGTGPNAVFAVGARRVLRYDGNKWSVMSISPAMATRDLRFISGTSTSDIWVAAFDGVFHYNGSQWEPRTPTTMSVDVLVMTSTNDGWLVGQDTSKNALMYRWNGSSWDPQSIPFSAATSMWARSPTDVYATSLSSQQLQHFTGTWSTPILDSSSSPVQATLLVGSASDILAVRRASSFIDNGYYHFTGSTWTFSDCCDDVAQITSLGGTGGDYILVGRAGEIMRFDGATWTVQPAGTTTPLNGVWGYAPGHVFIVGDGGTILY
jgi:cysteine-rich repeat protein